MTDHDLQRGRGVEHPRGVEAAEKYIRFTDGVAPEMLNAEYWEPENADKLLMTSKEITKLPENDLSSLLERAGALNAEEFCERLGKMAGLNPEKCLLNGKLFAMTTNLIREMFIRCGE